MIARIMKPCVVIVLDMLYKHLDPLFLTYISRSIDFVLTRKHCDNLTYSYNPHFFNYVKILYGVYNSMYLNGTVSITSNVIILPNAGAILTSAEFLFSYNVGVVWSPCLWHIDRMTDIIRYDITCESPADDSHEISCLIGYVCKGRKI